MVGEDRVLGPSGARDSSTGLVRNSDSNVRSGLLDAIRAESFAQGVSPSRRRELSCGQVSILSFVSSLRPSAVALAYEADLSTKEAQTCALPWIPDAHENACRPPCSNAAAERIAHGSHPERVTVRQKRRRLSRSAEFDRTGRRIGVEQVPRPLRLSASGGCRERRRRRSDQRLGVSVGRRVGGAVVRNRGEAVASPGILGGGATGVRDHDYVIVARPDTAALAEREASWFERAT